MKEKRSYLMANAQQVPDLVDLHNHYDEEKQINVEYISGRPRPLIMNTSIAHTGSKTMAAPGDDDPDPEDERCY